MQTSIQSLHAGTSAAHEFPFQAASANRLGSGSSDRAGLRSSSCAAQTGPAEKIEADPRPSARTDISHRFGLRLRALRRERNLTQVRMAADFGIDRSFISDVERGKKSLSLPMLEVIALGMEVSLSELLRDI